MCPVSVIVVGLIPFDVFVVGSREHLRINKCALYEMI